MDLVIVADSSSRSGVVTKLQRVTLPEAIRRLERYCKRRFGENRRKTNEFHWSCWSEHSMEVYLAVNRPDGTMPLEFVNQNAQAIEHSIRGLEEVVNAIKCVDQFAGRAVYRCLDDLLAECREVTVHAALECKKAKSGEGIAHADKMELLLRRVDRSLHWVDAQLTSGTDRGAMKLLPALRGQVRAVTELSVVHFKDVFGSPLADVS